MQCKSVCDVKTGIDQHPSVVNKRCLGFSQLSKPLKWQDLLEKGKKAAKRFEQVQRFILAEVFRWRSNFNYLLFNIYRSRSVLSDIKSPEGETREIFYM